MTAAQRPFANIIRKQRQQQRYSSSSSVAAASTPIRLSCAVAKTLVVGLSIAVLLILILTAKKNILLSQQKEAAALSIGGGHNSITATTAKETNSSNSKEAAAIYLGHDVAYLNQNHGSSADDVLEWVCTAAAAATTTTTTTTKQQQQPGTINKASIVQLTSFGASSLVILDKLKRRGDGCLQRIPVVFVDTLHLFPETYQYLDEYYRMNNFSNRPQIIHAYRPRGYKTRAEFDARYGADLYKTDPEKYAELTKIEPTQRALDDFRAEAWITGRRRSQGGERASLRAFEQESNGRHHHHRLKVNPLVDWTYEQVWDYIRKRNLPYNPLFDQGYKSIGDVQTTSKVAPDAGERSGRFQGLNQTECGMHDAKGYENTTISDNADERDIPSSGDYIEITPTTFNGTVLDESASNVFIVFYSPQCGHCRAFEPTFMKVAKELKQAKSTVLAARYNVHVHRVPSHARPLGIKASGVPALFLVQHRPLRVTKYDSYRDKKSILKWLKTKGEMVLVP